MCLCKNEVTDTLRAMLNNLLVRKRDTPFTVRDIYSDFKTILDLSETNLVKAISNELIRHRKSNRLIVVGRDESSIGRCALIYRQVWCERTLEILSREILETKFEIKKGEIRIYVYGCGMVRILKGFNVTLKAHTAELIDFHLKLIGKGVDA